LKMILRLPPIKSIVLVIQEEHKFQPVCYEVLWWQ